MRELEVTGNATPEEIAALVAVLAAVGGSADKPTPPARVWGAATRQVGGPVRPAPGAWRRSGLPR